MFWRTILYYFVLMVAIRMLGKRQLGQLEPSEVVVTMFVADLAAVPIQDPGTPVTAGLIPIGAVLLMEYVLSTVNMHSVKLRKLLCGKPVILMENGKFLQKNMRKTRVTLDELISQLRKKDVLDLSTVQYAILETGGNLSVFLYPEHQPATAAEAGVAVQAQSLPITLITDGRLLEDNLIKAGKDRNWLEKTLKKQKAKLENTFLLTVDGQGTVHYYPREK